MPLIGNSTILVVGGQILTTDDFVFEARQESIDEVIDDFGPPIINLISPSIMKEGERIEIIMSGNRTYSPLQAVVHGEGVTVDHVSVNSDGEVTLECTVDETALDNSGDAWSGSGSEQRDVTITTLAAADGSDLTDSEGNVVTKSTTLSNAFRVYFAEPSLTSSTISNLEQGQSYSIGLSGLKMYDKWDGQQNMSVDMGPSITVDSVVVQNPDSAAITFTVAADGQRGNTDVDVATYSGSASSVSGQLSNEASIYYRSPSATRLHSTSGPHSIDTDNATMQIEAGETFGLTLTGSRLEGISAAGRLTFIDDLDNLYAHLAISNAVENTPAGTGAGHSVSFDVTAAADAPEVMGANLLRLQYQTLSATGTHTAIFDCNLEIVPADPTISYFSIAAREGLIGTDNNAIELGDQTRSCNITGKNIRSQGLALKVMKNAAGTITDATSEFLITNTNLVDNGANADDVYSFDIQENGAGQTDASGQLKYFFKIDTASGSSSSTAASGANQLTVLPGNPTLTVDASGAVNHVSVRKESDSGTTPISFTLVGSNIYNAVAGNATMGDWATIVGAATGVFADGASGQLKMALSSESGISSLKCVALSDTAATVTGVIDNTNMAAEGLRDITITTRSGEATLLGVLDILPPAPSVSSVAPGEQEEGTAQTLTITGSDLFPLGAGQQGFEAAPTLTNDLEQLLDTAPGETYYADLEAGYVAMGAAFIAADDAFVASAQDEAAAMAHAMALEAAQSDWAAASQSVFDAATGSGDFSVNDIEAAAASTFDNADSFMQDAKNDSSIDTAPAEAAMEIADAMLGLSANDEENNA
tara:strand:+ start:6188 stop:8647 length:2460 start_codon:yes stop_codon:yes gene_type:complete